MQPKEGTSFAQAQAKRIFRGSLKWIPYSIIFIIVMVKEPVFSIIMLPLLTFGVYRLFKSIYHLENYPRMKSYKELAASTAMKPEAADRILTKELNEFNCIVEAESVRLYPNWIIIETATGYSTQKTEDIMTASTHYYSSRSSRGWRVTLNFADGGLHTFNAARREVDAQLILEKIKAYSPHATVHLSKGRAWITSCKKRDIGQA